MRGKQKVSINKVSTEVGIVPTIGNYQTVNRPTKVYYAEKGGSSVFYIIREKDVDRLKAVGYKVTSVEVPSGYYPVALNYFGGVKLEVRR